LCDTNNSIQYITKAMDRWLGTRFEFIGNLLFFGAAVVAVHSRGHIGPSFLALCMTQTMTVARAINYTLRSFTQAESEMTSVERVLHFALNLPREDYSNISNQQQDTTSPLHSAARGVSVKFDKVSFRYRAGLPLVLRGVDFHLPRGSRTGFVGRSGAGKSSIVHSLLRLSELRGEGGEGKILFDDVDISTMDIRALRRRVSVCPQDCVMFGGTIRSNIDPCEYYSTDSVARVLEQVDLVQQLGGVGGSAHSVLDRSIAECGADLSGGERQLLCLARVLLECREPSLANEVKGGRVVVLDEATSAADGVTDANIQRLFREGFAGITILVIAHRLRSIVDADNVVVMSSGKVAEFGPPYSLLTNEAGEIFASLVEDSGDGPELLKLAKAAAEMRSNTPDPALGESS
jgi:ABC-type multidrug transport system fused ATPase/permease subunit